MTMIVSSNRTRAEWAKLVERPFDPEFEMSQRPHQPATEVIARHAITPDPFAHIIAVDECGAPIHADTIGAEATIARLGQ